jgi:hypothetical protein
MASGQQITDQPGYRDEKEEDSRQQEDDV